MSLAIHNDGPMKSLEPPDSHYLIAADGWLGLGNWQEAQSEIERITPELRMHPDVQEVRWQIQAKAKNWEEAICVAREITQRTPELPFGWVHLAYSLHELRHNADIRIMPRRLASSPEVDPIL
jgi:predicted Zn-dependent protease